MLDNDAGQEARKGADTRKLVLVGCESAMLLLDEAELKNFHRGVGYVLLLALMFSPIALYMLCR